MQRPSTRHGKPILYVSEETKIRLSKFIIDYNERYRNSHVMPDRSEELHSYDSAITMMLNELEGRILAQG